MDWLVGRVPKHRFKRGRSDTNVTCIIHAYTHTHIRTYTHTHICTNTHTYAHTHKYAYTWIHTCIGIHNNLYAHRRTCTYAHSYKTRHDTRRRQYNAVLQYYSTIQYNAIQRNTLRYNTRQYNAIHPPLPYDDIVHCIHKYITYILCVGTCICLDIQCRLCIISIPVMV